MQINEKYKVSDTLFTTMLSFKKYVDDQGGDGLDFLDKEICPAINIMIQVTKVVFCPQVLSFGIKKTMVLSSAEQIIDRALKDGMSKKKYYKEIYQNMKSKVELFAELHGQSEVISKQLAIE